MTEFLDFCAKEKLPVDFISCHAYPTDYALDPVSGKGKDAVRYVHSLRDDLTYLHNCLAKSKYPKAEIHITEWSTSPSSRDVMHDALPPAAYILKGNLDNIGMANSLMYWTFTDIFEEKGGGEKPFHGGFGMINFQGMVKPSFHAYRMLNQLGEEKLYYNDPIFVSRHKGSGKVTALVFNYPDEFVEAVPSSKNFRSYMNASSKQVDMTLTGLEPGAMFAIEILDKQHGNVFDDYEAIGSPSAPTRQQTAWLIQKSWETKKETIKADANGRLVFHYNLQPWTCIMIKQL